MAIRVLRMLAMFGWVLGLFVLLEGCSGEPHPVRCPPGAVSGATPAEPTTGRARTPAPIETRKLAQTEARKCDGVLPALPDPIVWKVPPPKLTPDQRKRQQEVDQYLARRYCEEGYRIVTTTQNEIGDITDLIDSDTIEGALPPPPDPYESPSVTQLRNNGGPWPPTAMLRPTFAPYVFGDTGATSLEDWLDNYTVLSLPPKVEGGPSGRPASPPPQTHTPPTAGSGKAGQGVAPQFPAPRATQPRVPVP